MSKERVHNEGGSEDYAKLQGKYRIDDQHIQKALARRCVKETRLNITRGGRMFTASLPTRNACG